MARYFAGQGGDVVDDAEMLPDETLFHQWNAALAADRSLLLVSAKNPVEWAVTLPDLRSRLAAAQLIEIDGPDDELVEQLMLKHLYDRGTSIGPDTLNFVAKRIERTHSALEDFARTANARALAEGSAINLPLVRSLFLE
ncbi:MAG: hypothetical protein RL481_751 [Pseudomonadota bacterium]|jgi:chromosomal replication initiation ATPase DnaA